MLEQTQTIKEYTNAALYALSEAEFKKAAQLARPILDETDFMGRLEWALLYLDLKESPARMDDTRRNEYTLKVFDGAWLFEPRADGTDTSFLNFQEYQDMNYRNLYPEGFSIKSLDLGDATDPDKGAVTLQRILSLDDKQKRQLGAKPSDYLIQHRLAYLLGNDREHHQKERWYTSSDNWLIKPLFQHPRMRERTVEWLLQEQPALSRQQARDFLDDYLRSRAKTFGDMIYPYHSAPGTYIAKGDADRHLDGPTYWDRNRLITAHVMLLFTYHYEWSVYIKETPDSIGVRMPILPENHGEVFALRDLPTGAARRKAVVHTVRQHYRAAKAQEDAALRQTLVKQYFRGETKFNWRGLEVHIIPSQYDLNRTNTTKKFVRI